MSDSLLLERAALPDAVLQYIDESTGPARPSLARLFTDDAVVTDEGVTSVGRDRIARWLRETTGRFDYSLAFLSAEARTDGSVAVLHRMTGDFPGGEVDLVFVFALRDGLIAGLVFE